MSPFGDRGCIATKYQDRTSDRNNSRLLSYQRLSAIYYFFRNVSNFCLFEMQFKQQPRGGDGRLRRRRKRGAFVYKMYMLCWQTGWLMLPYEEALEEEVNVTNLNTYREYLTVHHHHHLTDVHPHSLSLLFHVLLSCLSTPAHILT